MKHVERKRNPATAGNNFEKYLQQKGLSKATVGFYNTKALDFITWCDMQNIDVENSVSAEVTGYLQHLKNKGYQNKTRNTHLGILKHYFDWQLQAAKRNDNPAKHIRIRGTKAKKLYPIFSKQELESLYHSYEIPTDAHRKSKCNWFRNYQLSRQRNKTILSLMIYQGLCTDEINRLTVNDIKLKEGTVFIAGTRKSNERILELKPHQVMEFMEYQLQVRAELQQLHPDKTERYFLPTPAHGKKTITDNDSINIWKRLTHDMKAANKKFINFQQVRTSVITHWLKQYNLRQVQYMAGHRYVSSTESYLANQMEDLQNDIDKLHPIG